MLPEEDRFALQASMHRSHLVGQDGQDRQSLAAMAKAWRETRRRRRANSKVRHYRGETKGFARLQACHHGRHCKDARVHGDGRLVATTG